MHAKPVALVTGTNQGIGLQIAKDLVAQFCYSLLPLSFSIHVPSSAGLFSGLVGFQNP